MNSDENNNLSNAASVMGQKGGSATSPAKQVSSRKNGKLGGRPPTKPCPKCGHRMIAVDDHWSCTNANCTETHAISQSGAIVESLVEESIEQAETERTES